MTTFHQLLLSKKCKRQKRGYNYPLSFFGKQRLKSHFTYIHTFPCICIWIYLYNVTSMNEKYGRIHNRLLNLSTKVTHVVRVDIRVDRDKAKQPTNPMTRSAFGKHIYDQMCIFVCVCEDD